MSAETNRIDYEYRKRDLATKYSFAISRLGTCAETEKPHWLDTLSKLSQEQHNLEIEFKQQV